MLRKLPSIAAIAATLSLVTLTAGCDLDIGDLNNPSIDDLEKNPTRASVTSAATGLLISSRRNRAAANGYISQLGILGRESYNFDGADPRFFGEMLEGQLQAGSPFGGNFWQAPYASIRLSNLILNAVDRVADFSEAERAAINGWAKTFQATDLLEVIATHDTNGAVIDTNRGLDETVGPVEGKDAVLAKINSLLDEANTDLGRGGDEFPFVVTSGFTGFDTPADFATYNRAMRARVAIYVKDYAAANTALAASFLDDMPMAVADLDVGTFITYSTSAGDVTNGLINPNIFAHPSFVADAQSNGANKDQRSVRKIRTPMTPGAGGGVQSTIKYTVYPTNASPVPLIRNEELILLRAEARFFTANPAGALADLNLVRTISGGLTPIVGVLTEAQFVTALLYERRYSLAFEGHRWIDVRRLGAIETLPLDVPGHVRNVRYPIPQQECNARPGEPLCEGGSL